MGLYRGGIYHTNPPVAAIIESSGSILKSGRVTDTTDAGGLLTINFPTPFPNSVVSVDAWMESADGDYVKLNAQPTVAGFVVRALNGAHTHTPTTAAVYSSGGVVSQTGFGTTAVVTGYASPTTASGYSGGGTGSHSHTAFTIGGEGEAAVTYRHPITEGATNILTDGWGNRVALAQVATTSTPTDTVCNTDSVGSAFTTTSFLTGLGAPTTTPAYTSGGVVSQTGFGTTVAVTAVGAGNEDVLAITSITVHYIAIGS